MQVFRPTRVGRARFAVTVFFYVLVSFSFGCNNSPYELAPVSGTVTLDGEPVAQARVIFEPSRTGEDALTAGPSSNGLTDEAGRYTLLTTVNEDEGAVIGSHTITISTYLGQSDRSKDTGQVIRKEVIPARYREAGALTFDVPSNGTDTADFSLKSKK